MRKPLTNRAWGMVISIPKGAIMSLPAIKDLYEDIEYFNSKRCDYEIHETERIKNHFVL